MGRLTGDLKIRGACGVVSSHLTLCIAGRGVGIGESVFLVCFN